MGDLKTDAPFAEAGLAAQGEGTAEKDTGRVETFSDGEDAIALTLRKMAVFISESRKTLIGRVLIGRVLIGLRRSGTRAHRERVNAFSPQKRPCVVRLRIVRF